MRAKIKNTLSVVFPHFGQQIELLPKSWDTINSVVEKILW